MLRKHLGDRATDSLDFAAMASKMEGYSGADLELVCREAAMRPVRRLVQKLQELECPEPPKGSQPSKFTRSNANGFTSPRSLQNGVSQEEVDALLAEDPVANDDMLAALAGTKPSSDGNMAKYRAWQEEFGAV
eukprot:GSChrysophyteH1.ASY1.ANO1.3247.1 assembled CDS